MGTARLSHLPLAGLDAEKVQDERDALGRGEKQQENY